MYHSKSPLFSIALFADKHKVFSESSLRHLIFNACDRYSSNGELIKGNGLRESGAIIRIGRRVLIHEDKFMDWAMSTDLGAA